MFKAIHRACTSLFRWRRNQSALEAVAPPPASADHNIVRGYDTPELFKSDTLTRLRHMEQELAAQRARIEQLERRIGR